MKELKVIVLQGVPASGKSTWARNEVSGKKDIVIVNRDSIRDSLGDYLVPEREDLVTSIETESVIFSLKRGFNVIIDATNLNPKTIKKWEGLVYMFNESQKGGFNKYQASIEKKFFDISLDEAILRDSNRQRSVGEGVIKSFFERYIKSLRNSQVIKDESKRFYLNQDISKPHCIIVDIDGTVALMKGRSPYNLSKVGEDVPNLPLIAFIWNYLKGNKVIVNFVSGRESICREETREWLRRNGFSGGCNLFMRNEGDYRSDSIVKEEIFREHVEPYYYVEAVFDDRKTVCEMWRRIGLLCLNVWFGDF